MIDPAVTAPPPAGRRGPGPGMKYRHYAPQRPVLIVSGSREKAAAYIRAHFSPATGCSALKKNFPYMRAAILFPTVGEADVASLSAGLFAALRILDSPSVGKVFARCPVGGGVAYAVQNRLQKAAAFHIVDAEAES